MYTLQALKEVNPHREHLIDDSTLTKVNKILKNLSPGEDIKPGDVVKYTDEGGRFCRKAFINNDTSDHRVYICENSSVHVFLKDDDLGFSTSGGSWKYIPKDELKKIGTTKKMFWIWGNNGATENGGIHFEADVNYWEYNVNKGKFSEENYDISYINYDFKNSSWSITQLNNSVYSRNIKEKELILFLNINKSELEIREDKIIAWSYKTKDVFYREEDELKIYDELDLPDHIVYKNASYVNCKIEYKDTTIYMHWAHQTKGGCSGYGIEVDELSAHAYILKNEESEKYSSLLEEFKRGKDEHVVWRYQESVFAETEKETLIMLKKGDNFLVHEINSKTVYEDGIISSVDFTTKESLIFFLRRKLVRVKKIKIHESFKKIMEEVFEG